MKRLAAHIAVIATLSVAFASCSKPAVSESFVSIEDRDVIGSYVFDMDLCDSLAAYDLYLYTRVDQRPSELAAQEDMELRVRWISPQGERYEEQVYFPVREKTKALYRSDFVPVEPGIWKLELSVRDEVEGLRGMGLVLERKDGTR